MNGEVRIQDLYKDNLIYANVNVNQWGVNRDTLGVLDLNSRWDASNSAFGNKHGKSDERENPYRGVRVL